MLYSVQSLVLSDVIQSPGSCYLLSYCIITCGFVAHWQNSYLCLNIFEFNSVDGANLIHLSKALNVANLSYNKFFLSMCLSNAA